MTDSIEGVRIWLRWGIALVGVGALVVGGVSVVAPTRSIALYQWLMARFNWRVSPIDEAREVRNTRLLGALLVLLSLALLWGRFLQRI